jgi:epoxide hydrolase
MERDSPLPHAPRRPEHRVLAPPFARAHYSLLDSPAGLAAWLCEKLVAFAGTRPEAGGGVSLAQQLDNIALYWFTGTGASTARWYWEATRWVRGPRRRRTRR